MAPDKCLGFAIEVESSGMPRLRIGTELRFRGPARKGYGRQRADATAVRQVLAFTGRER
jgi:hypothetical protein